MSLRAGICPAQQIVCVVVDECHRATGKSEIVPALGYLRSQGVKFRVLGLSATPGSKKESIQVKHRRRHFVRTFKCSPCCLFLANPMELSALPGCQPHGQELAQLGVHMW